MGKEIPFSGLLGEPSRTAALSNLGCQVVVEECRDWTLTSPASHPRGRGGEQLCLPSGREEGEGHEV